MSYESACVMLKLNEIYPVFDKNNNYILDPARDLIRQIIRSSPSSRTPLRISTKTAEKIYESSRSDNEFLEKQYFNGRKNFTEFFKNIQTVDFDDTLTVSNFDSEELAEILLSGMYILAERLLITQEKQAQCEKIQNSFWWRSMLVLQELLDALFPPNSRRLRAVQWLIAAFRELEKKTA